MIDKIEIQGYKSIKKQSVALSPINVFIGANGAGKTNFISIFSFIRNMYERNLQQYVAVKGGSNSFFYMGKKVTDAITLKLYFKEKEASNPHNYFEARFIDAQDRLLIAEVQTGYSSGGSWHPAKFESNVQESSFRDKLHSQAFWVNRLLRNFEVYHFHDTSERSALKGRSHINDNSSLRRDGGNLASFLYYLKEKHPKHFMRIERMVASISPFFDCFILEPDRLTEDWIQLQWKQKGMYDSYFNAHQLSDGTLRFICLATLLLQPSPPGTIIIDEPELGLHPIAIGKLSELMKVASHQSQIIVSTQSVTLLDNFSPKDIICVNHQDDATVFNRLEEEELKGWLEDYSLGEIWEKNVFGANF